MSKDIYTIQRTLNEILDIEGDYTISDAELFDCSDAPNDGKCSGHFDRTGIPHTEETKKLIGQKMSCINKGRKHSASDNEKKSKRLKGNTQGFTNGHTKSFSWAGKKLSAEHKKKISETLKKKKRIVV